MCNGSVFFFCDCEQHIVGSVLGGVSEEVLFLRRIDISGLRLCG